MGRRRRPPLRSGAGGHRGRGSEVSFSAASAWELAIKAGLGRLETEEPLPKSLEEQTRRNGFRVLPIHFSHAAAVATLPPFHRDPFDRLLIAQARIEGLVLVSRDRLVSRYDVEILW